MLRYFLHRLLLIIPTFLGITILLFAITRFVPGGPVDQAIEAHSGVSHSEGGRSQGKQGTTNLSDAQLAQLKAFYGLDQPIISAYFQWLGKLVTLDFGKSTRYGDPVLPMILERVPVSLWFGIMALILTYLVSIPLGVSKALRHRTLYDNTTSIAVFVGYALPGYIVGILLLALFSFQLGWLPLGGIESPFFNDMNFFDQILDRVTHLALPLTAYIIGDFAVMTMMMKNNLMENMAADYVKTAVAKGLGFKQALWRHGLRNSFIPIAASFGSILTVFLAGSFLIEQIFNIRGMGLLGFDSLMSHDYPVVMGILSISAFVSLLANILSDLFVSLVDPRVRFGA